MAVYTSILSVGRIGFYSDDWDFLRIFRFAPDQSLAGIYKAAFAELPHARMRPLELLYLGGLYKVWGIHPFGYQVTNVLALGAIGLLLWVLLRELGQARVTALAASIVYLTLPNYTTARFWMSAYENTLSIALFLLSLYADLRSLRSSDRSAWRWRFLGVVSLIGCLMAYEVVLPLFAINIAVVLLLRRNDGGPRPSRRAWITAALEVTALLGVAVFKMVTRTRGVIHDAYIPHAAQTIASAFRVNLLGYGFGLPLRAWRAVVRYPDTRILVMTIVLAIAVAAYLWRVADREKTTVPTSRTRLIWLAVGIIAFVLGHVIYLVAERGSFTMTGSYNRVAVASTVGVALCFVSGTMWLVSLIPEAMRGAAFGSLIGLLAAGGFAIDNTVANFWADAYRKEMAVLTSIRERFPMLPPYSTLILDGVCPYDGPAVVFDSGWDLAGLLTYSYNDPTLLADVAGRRMTVRAKGLVTSIHGQERVYPFSDVLFVFDPRSGYVLALRDRATALRYFEQRREPRCPPGRPGLGVEIL